MVKKIILLALLFLVGCQPSQPAPAESVPLSPTTTRIPQFTKTPAAQPSATPARSPQPSPTFPPMTPPMTREVAFTFDHSNGELVAFGGIGACNPCGDLYAWDGKEWDYQSVEQGPSPRSGAEMVFHAGRNAVLLFGGTNAGKDLNDTWLWDGQDWTEMHPEAAPPARFDAKLAYDSARDQVVLYGGFGLLGDGHEAIYYNDTWTWDGQTWTEHKVESPPNGAFPPSSMTYDPVGREVLLLNYMNGLWAWDGQTWQKLPNQNRPEFFEGQIGYDEARQQVVFLGKRIENEAVPETWTWDGQTWTLAGKSPEFESILQDAQMLYDPIRQALLYITPSCDKVKCSLSILAWTGSEWQDAAGLTTTPRSSP